MKRAIQFFNCSVSRILLDVINIWQIWGNLSINIRAKKTRKFARKLPFVICPDLNKYLAN
jgi:hypothetical protein